MNPRIRLILRPPALSGGARPTERIVEVEAAAGEVHLGRGPDLSLTLPFPTVSTMHARIFVLEDQWWVEDLESVNGTWLGPRRIGARRPEPIRTGDELRLADITVIFAGVLGQTASGEVAKSAEVHGTTTIARRLVADLFGAVRPTEVAVLEVVAGSDVGQKLPLPDNGRTYRVGRGPTCDLILSDPDTSREHLSLERRWDGIFVQDLGSRNGVTVAGRRIAGSTRVGDGIELSLGATRLRLDDPEDRYLRLMESHPQAVGSEAASIGHALASQTSASAVAETRDWGAPGARATRSGVKTSLARSRTQRLPLTRRRGGAVWIAILAGGVLLALVGLVLVLVL